MDSLNFNVSSELKLILQRANKLARENSDKEITLELVTYLILDEYNSKNASESELIKRVLGDYSKANREDILDLCLREYRNKAKKTTLPGHFDDYTLSKELEVAFDKANTYKNLKRILIKSEGSKANIIITTEDLLMWGILFSKNNPLILELKDTYDFNAERFMAIQMSAEIFDELDNEAVLKEKILETPPPPTTKEKKSEKKEDDEEENQQSIDEKINEDDEKFEKAAMSSGAVSIKKRDPHSSTPVLDQYGLDMTEKARLEGYDPVIGREKEISQVIEILCCRKKNNAALLGEAGVGKTAIVEGLARKISIGDVPHEIKGKKIFSVSTTDLQAGTIYRGQLEERIQELCNEVRKNKDVIVYIDEFHQAVSEGSSNIAQMLKPSLARGEMNMIISTTTSEYRKFIEKDAALKRRFEPVQIEEPDMQKTKDILKGISNEYAKYHRVRFTNEVIGKCVDWSGQYITDRQFPDKAIGILDMSASLTKLENQVDYKKRDELQRAIDTLNEQADKAIENSEFERASKARDARIKVEEELKNLIEAQESNPETWPEVTINSVSKVISKISGVPIDKIQSSSMSKIKEMKTRLEEKVIGQDQAVSELVVALQRNILGLRDPKKPIASFLLVGPTGVGKSYVSKILASEFFGSEKSLITIACSEYMQDWSESKLLGSAPGYVGFSDSEPRLYVLKRRPFCVLLIDEIEKSSSNLYNIWLNMLEEGEVTLSSGEKVSCRDCIIIFTGNVGTKSLELKSENIGFGSIGKEDKKKKTESTVMKEIKKEFRPEFLNRLSKIIVFNSLEKEELTSIFDLELGKLQERLKDYKISISKKLKSWIVDKCDPKYGARSLQRLLIEYIEQELCKAILEIEDIDSRKKPIKVKFDLDKDNDKVLVII